LTNIKEKAIELNSTYGFNVIPMYYLHRNSGVKKVKMIDWQKYKAEMYDLSDWRDEYKALAIMTGSISNLSILDIDSEEALDTILDALGGTIGDLANYIVKTTKGYQLFYTYESNTSTSIGVRDKVDFLSGGVTFAVEPNEGYTLLKQGKPEAMPTELKELILDDANSYEPQSDTAKAFANAIRENSSLPFTNPLYPTIKKFVDSTRITNHKDLEKVFCTKDYAGKSELHYIDYYLDNPKYDVDECRRKGLTFSASLMVTFRLIIWDINEETEEKSLRDIKEQVVTFIAKEKIDLYGKTYEVDHFKLRSKNMNLPKDKRLNFDIWYDQKTFMILRVKYSRMGNWEYRLKNFE